MPGPTTGAELAVPVDVAAQPHRHAVGRDPTMPPRGHRPLAAALISSGSASPAAASKHRTSEASTRAARPGWGDDRTFERTDPICRTCDTSSTSIAQQQLGQGAGGHAQPSHGRRPARARRGVHSRTFCMPAVSAWPGRGWVSGCCGPVLGPYRHLGAPLSQGCASTRCWPPRSPPANRGGRGARHRGSTPRPARSACGGRS